jgi:hypothetical protein
MSHLSSLHYDENFIKQQAADSLGEGNYRLVQAPFVNPGYSKASDEICSADSSACAPCSRNSNAVVTMGPESFGSRVNTEDNLRGTRRSASKVTSEKFAPCGFPTPSRIEGECDNVIAFNPRVCDRNIVPSNAPTYLKKPF